MSRDASATEKPPCRSVGPSQQPCSRRRGHLPQWHSGATADGVQENWTAGVNTPAVVYVKVPGPKPIKGGCVRCGSTKRKDPGGSAAERNPGICSQCLQGPPSHDGPQSEADFQSWGRANNGW